MQEKKKISDYACITHNGEHPFFWKETIADFVTYCHELYHPEKAYPLRRRRGKE